MVQKRWFSLAKQLLVSVALPLIVTGCNGLPFHPAVAGRHVPLPVTEDGMTLVWGVDVKRQALGLIESSRRQCYLDIYELSDPDILNALSAAKHRGVDVRVVLDATEAHSQSVGMPTLQQVGVPVESLHIARGISHVKMLIADGRVLLGGMNFGAQSWSNNDASVVLAVANPSFVSLFQWDWNRAAGSPTAAPSYEVPLLDDRDNEAAVVQAIQSATKDIAMEAFDLSDRTVVAALGQAVKRGVALQVLLDPNESWSRSAATTLRTDGADVRYYTPYRGELMHAKIVDVDDGATFIIGSANFSHQAYTYNHEADLLLHNVSRFDRALKDNLAVQMARGSDSPGPSIWG